MLRVDCFDFYNLGIQIHPLTVLADDISYNDAFFPLYLAKDALDTFFRTFPLKTSRQPAIELYQAISLLIPDDISTARYNHEDGTPVNIAYPIGSVKKCAKEFETVLKAELGGWDAYFVSQKGAFSTTELIQQAELLVPMPARSMLSAKGIADFRQAGTCLAFNLGTAAAFHVVRATEEVIKVYYTQLLGTLPAVKLRNWGAYHRALVKCGDADAKTLGWLKHLTEEYRNPILHPEEMLSADDAIEFINACIALISSISKAIGRLEVTDGSDGARELRSGDEKDS